jgi:hypothetical protein
MVHDDLMYKQMIVVVWDYEKKIENYLVVYRDYHHLINNLQVLLFVNNVNYNEFELLYANE